MNQHYHKGLYRSSNQTVIGGVAAGIAEHLNTDPNIIRIIFAILALFGGSGLLIYVILWVAVPAYETTSHEAPRFYAGSGQTNYNRPPEAKEEENKEEKKEESSNFEDKGFTPPFTQPPKKKPSENGGLIAGIFMIVIGFIFLADKLFYVGFRHLWPLLLLVVGILLIKSAYNKPDKNNSENNDQSSNQIYK